MTIVFQYIKKILQQKKLTQIQILSPQSLLDPQTHKFGVETFVPGTVVKGDLCPRYISPRSLLSKETLVQGDFCTTCNIQILMDAHSSLSYPSIDCYSIF